VDLPAELRSLEPGLHLHADPRPLVLAQQLANELDGRLCTTPDETDALLADLGEHPPLDADTLTVLGDLAARVCTVQRIVERTVDRAAEAVGERLAVGTGMAIHPSAVRGRAETVLSAREAAAAAEERLRETEAEAAEEAERTREALAERPAFVPTEPTTADAPRKRRLFGRRREKDVEDTRESTSLLQQVAAATDEAFGARRASAARDDQLLLLRAQRDRAMEEVRVAERAWRDLAGDDPVEDVEAVVRRFDPQHQDALLVARETIGVRAVSTLLDRASARWEDAWRELGFDSPPVEPASMPTVVKRGGQLVVLVGGAVDRAAQVVEAAPAAPVVAVEAAS
jgi:hypothetical protein